jgi:DNA polymerase III delta prime subunit
MALLEQNTIIQNTITEKLASFITQHKIPHILFHGPSGSGKRTLVYKFVEAIYHNDKDLIKNYTMFADCAHGKGIKFIREELKFFAKTNVNIQGTGHFKTIVLTNADKLTTDAQSALRRCIELFSHNTRFFIIVENKYNLLKPILSRLCDIFISGIPQTSTSLGNKINTLQSSGDKHTNIHKLNITTLLDTKTNDKLRLKFLDNEFHKLYENEHIFIDNTVKLVNKLYQKGYSGLDLMNYIEGMTTDIINTNDKTDADADTHTAFLLRKYKLLIHFHKVKTEFRNEKIFMSFILSFFFIRSNASLENISFM